MVLLQSDCERSSEGSRGGRLLRPHDTLVDGELVHHVRGLNWYPSLRIISGVELGEPHWHPQQVDDLLTAGGFDLVLGSLHGLMVGGPFTEVAQMLQERDAAEVIREYLLEVERLITGSAVFEVLAHIDYPVRYWDQQVRRESFDPNRLVAFDPSAFEDEYRHVLAALATSERILEVNTARTPMPEIVRWWREAGGRAVTFGSDAHTPTALARGFIEAAALIEAEGFRPGRDPIDVWHRA